MPAVAKAPKTLTVKFTMEKETLNTVRFEEQGDKTQWKVGRIYVKKDDLKTLGNPKVLEVTITGSK